MLYRVKNILQELWWNKNIIAKSTTTESVTWTCTLKELLRHGFSGEGKYHQWIVRDAGKDGEQQMNKYMKKY